ncbi:MAG: transglutaminase-like domain-containing protein [Verrucomicrobiota bacterium]
MLRIILIPALLIAFVTLRGWPVEWDFWFRTFVALAALAAAFAMIGRYAAIPYAPRFRNRRKPGVLDRVAGGSVVAVSLVSLYLVFVFGPSNATRWSYEIVRTEEVQLEPGDEGEFDWDAAEANAMLSLDEETHTEVRTIFDPDGAAVPNSANLTLTDKPEVRLTLADSNDADRLFDSGPVYVSAFAHDSFDGDRWTSQPGKDSSILTPNREGLIPLRPAVSSPDFDYTILQGRHFDRLNTVSLLQGAVAVRLPEVTRISPGTWLLPILGLETTYFQYQASSSPLRFEDLVENEIAISAGLTDTTYLLPTSHPGLHLQILALATRFDPALSLEGRLTALRDWLRKTYSYSLQVDYPDNGKCALENFLGDSDTKNGFCIHFASAAVLLAREMGVPARISFGWTGGRYYKEHGQFVFLSKHGHAWPEIFLQDHGWVVFEATPVPDLPSALASVSGETPPSIEAFLPTDGLDAGRNSFATLPSGWVWILILCGASLIILVILRAFKRGQSHPGMMHSPIAESSPPPGYLNLFHQACARLGHPMPTGRTLSQHLEALQDEQIPIQFADPLLSYHYDVTYRNLPRDSQTEKRLCQSIKSW